MKSERRTAVPFSSLSSKSGAASPGRSMVTSVWHWRLYRRPSVRSLPEFTHISLSKPPSLAQSPYLQWPCSERFRAGREPPVTYTITDPCIGTKDRSCVDVCPVDCIHDDGDDDKILYIDPD